MSQRDCRATNVYKVFFFNTSKLIRVYSETFLRHIFNHKSGILISRHNIYLVFLLRVLKAFIEIAVPLHLHLVIHSIIHVLIPAKWGKNMQRRVKEKWLTTRLSPSSQHN